MVTVILERKNCWFLKPRGDKVDNNACVFHLTQHKHWQVSLFLHQSLLPFTVFSIHSHFVLPSHHSWFPQIFIGCHLRVTLGARGADESHSAVLNVLPGWRRGRTCKQWSRADEMWKHRGAGIHSARGRKEQTPPCKPEDSICKTEASGRMTSLWWREGRRDWVDGWDSWQNGLCFMYKGIWI